jgi:hypothetical protein
VSDLSWLINPGAGAAAIGASFLTLLLRHLAAPYLDAYSRQKGQNLATHEDLDKLVAQMKAVTAATENIKAVISDDVWDRQKQWELRRDTLFEALRALSDLDYALIELHSVYSSPIPDPEDLKLYRMNLLQEKAKSFDTCNARFNSSMFLARMVVGKELHRALTECVNEMRSVSRKILNEETAYYTRSESDVSSRNPAEFNTEALMQKIMAVVLSARKALKIEITE